MKPFFARTLALSCLVASAGVGAIASAGSAAAANDNRFSLNAQADGMYILLVDGFIPAGLPGAISPYAAQATTNSQGKSTAFAGAPYLGPLLQTLPGLVGGLSGSTVPPLPPLPGFVESSSPSDPANKQVQGPYLLSADSSDTASNAQAGVGIGGNAGDSRPQIFATANTIANDDGSVSAKAAAGVNALNIGPLNLLNISSTASITEAGDGKDPVIVNTTDLGTIQVLGFKIGLDQSGFQILGANLPAPTSVIFDAINSALTASGIKITLLPSVKTKNDTSGVTTVTTAGLQVSFAGDIPTQGHVTADYLFGRATVSSSDVGTSTPPDTSSGGTTTTPPAGGGTETGTTTPDTGTTTPDLGTGTTDTPPLDTGSLPGGDSLAPTVAQTPTDSGTTGGGSVPSTGSNPTSLGALSSPSHNSPNSELMYLVLVLGGLGVLGGQQLFSRFGINLLLREG